MGNIGTGFVAAAVAAVGFGSNFIPVKQYDMADGMFFSMAMALGIWIFGMLYEVVRATVLGRGPYFHSMALLGGIIWNTGNVLTVTIIKCIGLGLGLSIWSTVSLCMGWCTGYFGILGTPKDTSVKIEALNFIGITLAVCSVLIFANVQPSDETSDPNSKLRKSKNSKNSKNRNERFSVSEESMSRRVTETQTQTQERSVDISNPDPFSGHEREVLNLKDPNLSLQNVKKSQKNSQKNQNFSDLKNVNSGPLSAPLMSETSKNGQNGHNPSQKGWIDRLNKRQKQILGVFLSICSGLCYGTCFCPIQYVINSHKHDRSNYPKHLQDYAYVHFSGALISSIVYFVIYALMMKNEPVVKGETVLPSIMSGFVWAIAQTGFFIAVGELGTDTAFPIVSGSPQIIAALWGVLVFKEVTGRRNLLMLCAGMVVGLTAIACIATSKV